MMIREYDVVQFNEKHKWRGSLGVVEEVNESRIMVGVPIPLQGTAYIFAQPEELEYIGCAALIPYMEGEETDD